MSEGRSSSTYYVHVLRLHIIKLIFWNVSMSTELKKCLHFFCFYSDGKYPFPNSYLHLLLYVVHCQVVDIPHYTNEEFKVFGFILCFFYYITLL